MVGYPTKPTMDSENRTARFKIAVIENKKGCQRTNRFDCIARNEMAKMIVSKVKEGMQISIHGSLCNNDYEDGFGEVHTHTWVDVFDFLIFGIGKD